MIKILAVFFLIPFFNYSQSDSINFHSPKNKNKFADYLFCEGDYLRAVVEYESIIDVMIAGKTASSKFYVGAGILIVGNPDDAGTHW